MKALSADDEDYLILECKRLIRKTQDILMSKIKEGTHDIYGAVFSSVDFVQHRCWKYLGDPNNRYAHAIEEIYKEVDSAIGQILSLSEKDSTILVLSDHGFREAPKLYFHTNAWLEQEGYLTIKQPSQASNLINRFVDRFVRKTRGFRIALKKHLNRYPKSIQKKVYGRYFKTNIIDWSATAAFEYKMGMYCDGVVINKKGLQARGVVDGEESYRQIRENIISKLRILKDGDGKQVFSDVHRREDLYKGDYVKDIPDIIATFNHDYQPGIEITGPCFSRELDQSKNLVSGSHEQEGIFLLQGPNIKKKVELKPAEIIDIVPTILFDLELPIPDDMDGKPIIEAFREPFCSRPIVYSKKDSETEINESAKTSAEDHSKIEKALRGLGYVD